MRALWLSTTRDQAFDPIATASFSGTYDLFSASVVGLAIHFGSQGVVEDVVTGLTFIFSDLVDVGDLVEISGQTCLAMADTSDYTRSCGSLGHIVSLITLGTR